MEKLAPYFKINKPQKGIYDIELQNVDKLKKFSSVETHILVYPFSRDINADDISCNPFEEYAQDIKDGDSSVYSKVSFVFNKGLGIFLGVLILLVFLIWAPQAFLSIDSVVAIFAAYIIGKELGDDLESLLINLSHNWKLQFRKDYFRYKLELTTPMTNYTMYAKKQRYGKNSALPSKMDFDKRSNSQIIRMRFKGDEFEGRNNLHILSIKVPEHKANEFEKKGYIMGFRICLNKKNFIVHSTELFQAVFNGNIGCLDDHDKILKDTVFCREISKLSRFRYNSKKEFCNGRILA